MAVLKVGRVLFHEIILREIGQLHYQRVVCKIEGRASRDGMPKENIHSTCDVVEGGGGDCRTPKEVSGIVQILSRP